MVNSKHRKIRLEACIFDGNMDIDALLDLLFFCDMHNVDTIAVPPTLLQYKQRFTTRTEPACLIDFPLGLGTLRSRIAAAIDAISLGTKIMDICCNPMYIHNFQRRPIEKDVRAMKTLGNERGVEIRYIVDHRPYTLKEYVGVASFLRDCGIDSLITGPGVFVDDPVDNLICAEQVARDLPINVIASSLMFEPQHAELLENTKVDAIRVCSDKIKRFLGGKAYK